MEAVPEGGDDASSEELVPGDGDTPGSPAVRPRFELERQTLRGMRAFGNKTARTLGVYTIGFGFEIGWDKSVVWLETHVVSDSLIAHRILNALDIGVLGLVAVGLFVHTALFIYALLLREWREIQRDREGEE